MEFSKNIRLGDFVVSQNGRAYIIAEAGVNHNGDMDVAEEMIKVAAEAEVDAVKFQFFHAEHLILDTVQKAPYQLKTTNEDESQYEMLKKLQVTQENNYFLKDKCKEYGVDFLTTAFDEYSLALLDELDLPAYKVSSTDVTNLLFLEKVALKSKPIILSTGMTYLKEVETALKRIQQINQDVILLQCSSNYPVADDEVNLNVMHTFRDQFDILVGYSDHTVGVGASPYAIAMGAKVIEKHFTLNKEQEGPDHKASLDPAELKQWVDSIKRAEIFMGSFEKFPVGSEEQTRKKLQKCLVASEVIREGGIFTKDNIIAKRTGGEGISPIDYEKVVGRKAIKSYQKNEIINI